MITTKLTQDLEVNFLLGVVSNAVAGQTLVDAGVVARHATQLERATPVGDVCLGHLIVGLVPGQLWLGVTVRLAAQAHRRVLLHHDLPVGRLSGDCWRNCKIRRKM